MTDVHPGEPLSTALAIASGLVLFGMGACMLRLWRGPTTADRVLALDLLAYQVVGMGAIVALSAENIDLLAPALVLALISFLATVALARHIERGSMR